VFCFGKAKDVENDYISLFGCESGSFPFKYFGIPIHLHKLKNGEWKLLKDRFEKRLACWLRKLLSYGDRLVLINSVLTSLTMFMLSIEIPIVVRKRFDFLDHDFFWQSDAIRESID
jgi:hypothetical protein